MSNQLLITSGAKVRDLNDVIIGTSGVLSSLAFDVANGVPKLDANGKILVNQLPNSVMEYKGTWNANTNTPTLVNGTGNQGDVYLCTTAGTVDFGAGAIAFIVGDSAIYSGSVYQRSGGATGSVSSVGLSTTASAFTIGGSPVTTSGTISFDANGNSGQYINGAGSLTTFPSLASYITLTSLSANSPLSYNNTTGVFSIAQSGAAADGYLSSTDFNFFNNKQPQLNGTGFVKATGTTISYDNSTYLTGNQTITLSGDISGSGATAITTTIGALAVTNAMLFGSIAASKLVGTDIATVGTITSGTWQGTAIADAYISSAATWNAKQAALGGTGIVKSTSGTITYLTDNSTNWNTAYNDSIVSAAVTGTTTKTLTLTQQDAGTITASWTDDNTDAVTSVFGRTGAVVATEGDYSLTQLSDVTITAPSSGQVLKYNGTAWINNSDTDTGITSLNGLTALTQTFAVGTSGTDFAISSATSTHTFNLPTASAVNRGALSSADWTTFNNKESVLTFSTGLSRVGNTVTNTITQYTDALARAAISLTTTGTSGASTYNNTTGVLNIPNYADQYVGTVTSVSALTLGTSGTDLSSSVANSTTTPVITLNVPTASAANRGALSAADFTTFTNKQAAITLTTTGTSGAATFSSNTLNIPNYGSALSGYLPLTGGTLTGTLNGTNSIFTSNGNTFGNNAATTHPIIINTNISEQSIKIIGVGADNSSYIQYFASNGSTYLGYLSGRTSGLFLGTSSGDALKILGLNTTLLGTLTGTSATFSSNIGLAYPKAMYWNTISDQYIYGDASGIYLGTANANRLSISTSGAATFSSSVTANSVIIPSFETATNVLSFRSGIPDGTNVGIRAKAITTANRDGLELLGYNGIDFSIANGATVAMRITSGGKVNINNTANTTYQLYVDGGSAEGAVITTTSAANQLKLAGTAPALTITNTVSSPTIGGSLGACTSANQFLTGTAAGDMILINQYTGNKLYITNYSGGVYLTQGATSWTANSDIRIKDINSHITNAVEKLSTLQTINFCYKDDIGKKENLGLIAQEVEMVFPELIETNNDGILGVRYTELIPVLIKAIQELKAEINELKNK